MTWTDISWFGSYNPVELADWCTGGDTFVIGPFEGYEMVMWTLDITAMMSEFWMVERLWANTVQVRPSLALSSASCTVCSARTHTHKALSWFHNHPWLTMITWLLPLPHTMDLRHMQIACLPCLVPILKPFEIAICNKAICINFSLSSSGSGLLLLLVMMTGGCHGDITFSLSVSRAEVDSSSSRILGSRIIPLAIAMRCFCLRESWEPWNPRWCHISKGGN